MNNKSSGALVWGTILLGFGFLLMIKKLGWLDFDWSAIVQFWPVLIIGAGFSLLMNQSWSRAVTAVLIALAIPSAIVHSTHRFANRIEEEINSNFDDNQDKDDDSDDDEDDNKDNTDRDYKSSKTYSSTFSESLTANLATASLDFESGAGRFTIDGTTDQLIEAEAESMLGNYVLTNKRNDSDKSSVLSFKMESSKKDSVHVDIHDWKKSKNHAKMSLSNKPLWTVNVSMGAGKGDFDLSEYKVKEVNLETGVSDIDLKLGDKSDFSEINIKSGVASIDIEIPENVGCEFISKSALTVEDLDDFEKTSKGTHRTPNYDKATKKIRINYEGGLSSINIKRH